MQMRKGPKGAGQIEALYNFGELAMAAGLTNPHLAAHEKPRWRVRRIRRPGGGDLRQFFVA
jgi:hypothetical protein